MAKALRDLPEAELKQRVVEALQNLQGALLRAATETHGVSICLTLDHPERSAAPGAALDDVSHRLGQANLYLRDALAAWEVILAKSKGKR